MRLAFVVVVLIAVMTVLGGGTGLVLGKLASVVAEHGEYREHGSMDAWYGRGGMGLFDGGSDRQMDH